MAQIIGKCQDHLRQSHTVEEIWGSILKDLLIESDYTVPARLLALYSFPYNSLTLIYDQGMAHPFHLFTVPYHFSIQPEESPTVEEAIKNLGSKLIEEQPEAEHAKASKEGNFTSCSLPAIPTLSATYI